MPEINGIELVRMIKQGGRTRETPVVMMSTESSDADRDRSIASGADDFLAKPFTAMELRAVLDKHLNVAKVDSVADKVAD
jgi:CheY-like chemotaxis protein